MPRSLGEQPRGKRIVLVTDTDWGQEEDRRRSHVAGFDRHLVKPIDAAVLDGILASVNPAPRQLPGADP
jgi:hypothetical protein